MENRVIFSAVDNNKTRSPLKKIEDLMNRFNLEAMFGHDKLIAIKAHFGELGNTAFVRPIFLRPVIEKIKTLKSKPFITDTNTLYIGMRTNSVDHLHNAALNGFNYSTLHTPVIIADGLRGESSIEVEVESDLIKKAKLASEIVRSDGLIVISHFKGHEVSGFGGAIKNISMGCASRAGKLEMHSNTRPYVDRSSCTGCRICAEQCSSEAIECAPKAHISDNCVGCSRCIAVCPEQAIKIDWNESCENTMKKMIDYARATHALFKGKVLYINIMTDISPACDCYPGNDKPITQDIGFAAATDPIALDKACWDMVKKQMGKEPFHEIYRYLDPRLQFDYAREKGFGSEAYNLHELGKN